MSAEWLILRADANFEIGTGHVMRCLALAQRWMKEGGQVAFVIRGESAPLQKRLEAEGVQVFLVPTQATEAEDIQFVLHVAQAHHPNWIVVDGYHFTAEYQFALKRARKRLLCIDDDGRVAHYAADIIFNPNFGATAALYPNRESYTQLVLGTDYTLIRTEFLNHRIAPKIIPAVAQRLLITMGGSDPDNLTRRVLHALTELQDSHFQVRAIVGESNPHYDELVAIAQKPTSHAIRVEQNVSAMPEAMRWADVALIAAGGTLWELLFMGVPTLGFSRNQVQATILHEFESNGAVCYLGASCNFDGVALNRRLARLVSDRTTRKSMSAKGQRIIDGSGSRRLIRVMQEFNFPDK